MNCFFCQSNITHYRSVGLAPPAGTFQCPTCANLHGLKQVVMTINVQSMPLEAIINVDGRYHFRVDYYANTTVLIGPKESLSSRILTMEQSKITPQLAKEKLKTYLLFL